MQNRIAAVQTKPSQPQLISEEHLVAGQGTTEGVESVRSILMQLGLGGEKVAGC
ncbi:MAG: hypothetical protein AB9856_03695 [Cellulosilyticaceae bacterium]